MKNFENIFLFMRSVFNTHLIIKLVLIAVVMDCIFGSVRAFKAKKSNSSVGINGAIRKICMILCLAFTVLIDFIMGINLINVLEGFFPGVMEKILAYIPLVNIGLTEFFGLLFLAYELLSVLKNMYLCGLPVKKVWLWVDKNLRNYTDELPSVDLTQEEAIKQMAGDIQAISRSLRAKEGEESYE